MKHSLFSASSADRWLNCPGSVALSADAPRQDSVFAEEGRTAHQIAASKLERFLGLATFGSLPTDNEIIDKLDFNAINEYVELIKSEFNPIEDILLLEKRIELSHLDQMMFGTADAVLMKQNKAVIYDFKYGEHVEVQAYKNPQMMYYALMFLSAVKAYEEIELVIVQPRLAHGEKIKRWTCTREDLQVFWEQVKGAMLLAKRTSETVIGEHCLFCPAKAQCPSQRAAAEEILGDLEKPLVFVKPEELKIETISKVLGAKKKIEKWLEEIEKYAFAKASGGETIPGFKLVNKRTYLAWDAEAEQHFSEKCFKKTLMTPLQIKQRFPEYSELVDELSSRPQGGVTLVPIEDKRQPVAEFNMNINLESLEEY